MTDQLDSSNSEFRRRAEEQARLDKARILEQLATQSPEELQRLNHELQARVIELELQNEELRRTTTVLEATQARLTDLYDFAPAGYCILSEEGVILDINFTGASLLNTVREDLVNLPLSKFILSEDHNIYSRHSQAVLATTTEQICELRVVPHNKKQFWARLQTTAREERGRTVYRVILSDISESKATEFLKYHYLADSGQALIWTSGPDKLCNYFNQTWLLFTGRTLEQEIGNGWTEGVHPEDYERCLQTYVAAFDERRKFSMEYRLRHASGEYRWIQDDGTPCIDGKGQFLGYIGHCLDITERMKSEESLKLKGFYLEKAQEIGKFGYFNFDPVTGMVEGSSELYRIFDIQPNLPLFDAFAAAVHPEDGHLIFPCIEKAVGEGLAYEVKHRVLHRNGTVLHVQARGQIVDTLQGQKLIGIVQDITESEQAEAELMEYSQRLTLATASAKLGVWDWNVRDNIMVWDNHMFEFYGITRHTFPDNIDAWKNGLHPDDRQRAIDECNAALAGEKEFNTTFRVLHPDGTIKFLKADGMVLRDHAGKAVRMLGVNRDITELKKAEDEHKKLAVQLQHAQKMEAIGILAGGIAHDFNNMLGAILGYAEMIRDDFPPGSPGINDINQVLKASHRAKELVKQILAFSRQVEDRKIPMQPALVVKEAINLLRSSLPATITIKQDINSGSGIILADPSQIHQVVMNLCTNAFHAMETEGGTLTISLDKKILVQDDLSAEPHLQPGTFVELSIRDTGEGIRPEIREKIFDPFFTTKEVGKGTGLGLAMVYGIVKSCGGTITCDSRPGEGTEFRIILPILEGKDLQENASTEPTPHGQEHILLIDDEEILVELGQSMLKKLGYRVTTRRNSLDALTTFQNQPDRFDMVITDQTMPVMTGIDLARRMLQIRPEIPIILCTGYSSLITEDKVKATGIKGFALKPLTMGDLGKLIREILDQKKAANNCCHRDHTNP